MLERIELLLEAIRGELAIARKDREGTDRENEMGELRAALSSVDRLRHPE